MIDDGLKEAEMLFLFNFGPFKLSNDLTEGGVQFTKAGAFQVVGKGLRKIRMFNG